MLVPVDRDGELFRRPHRGDRFRWWCAREASSLGQYAATFAQLWWLALLIGGAFFLGAPLINRLMHGVK